MYCICLHIEAETKWTPFRRRHFQVHENVWIPITISLQFVPEGPINNIPALVQIIAWRRPGDKPLSETMMVSLTTHICPPRPQWVNTPTPPFWPSPWYKAIVEPGELANSLHPNLSHIRWGRSKSRKNMENSRRKSRLTCVPSKIRDANGR